MLLAALFLILREKQLEAARIKDEVGNQSYYSVLRRVCDSSV